MENKMLISTTAAFNLRLIRPGHLLILFDGQNRLIGPGIAISVEPLQIKSVLYLQDEDMRNLSSFEEDHQNILEQTTPYHIQIGQIESGEIQLFVIDPGLYELGEENVPVYR